MTDIKEDDPYNNFFGDDPFSFPDDFMTEDTAPTTAETTAPEADASEDEKEREQNEDDPPTATQDVDAQPQEVTSPANQSEVDQVTESDLLKNFLSSEMTEESRLKCRRVFGCEPLNLEHPDVIQAMIARYPELTALGTEEGRKSAMFQFYSGINRASFKLFNSIMVAAIARANLDLVISTMNSCTNGREKLVEFGRELQVIFIHFAERTNKCVLAMAKLGTAFAQVYTVLKYGAGVSCLMEATREVIVEASAEIRRVEEARQESREKILDAQDWMRLETRGNADEFDQLEDSKTRKEEMWNDLRVKLQTFCEELFNEKRDAGGALVLAQSRIESLDASIANCEAVKTMACERRNELLESSRKYNEMRAKLIVKEYESIPFPPPPDYEKIEGQMRRNANKIDIVDMVAKMKERTKEREKALVQRYKDMGELKASNLVDVDEMKRDLANHLSSQKTQRREAVEKNMERVENEIREIVDLIDKIEHPPQQQDASSRSNGAWWDVKKQQETQDTIISDLEATVTQLRKRIDELDGVRNEMRTLRAQLDEKASTASTGMEFVITSSYRSWFRRKYRKELVQTGPNVKAGLQQAAANVQQDIRDVGEEIERIETKISHTKTKIQRAKEGKQIIEENRLKKINERLTQLRTELQAKQDELKRLQERKAQVEQEVNSQMRQAHEDALQRARKDNEARQRQIEEMKQTRQAQEDAALQALRNQEQRSMLSAMDAMSSVNDRVENGITNAMRALRDSYANTCNKVKEANQQAAAQFEKHKTKALVQLDLQRNALEGSIRSSEEEMRKMDELIDDRRRVQDDERKHVEKCEIRLAELENPEGKWLKRRQDLASREAAAKNRYAIALKKFEEFQLKCDTANGQQFAKMRRALELLDVSTQNLPIALISFTGAFEQMEASLGGERMANLMAKIPTEKGQKDFLRDFCGQMQTISRIGWTMFDKPLQSLLQTNSQALMVSMKQEMDAEVAARLEKRKQELAERIKKLESQESSVIIEEVQDEDAVRMIEAPPSE